MQIKQFAMLAMSVGLLSCESVETTEGRSSADATNKLVVPDQPPEYGYMTPSGLVIHKNDENTADYESFVGAECIKHLKAKDGFIRRVKDQQPCQANIRYHPNMIRICQQKAIKIRERQQKDQECQQRVQAYNNQGLWLRAAGAGMTADFASNMLVVSSASFNKSTKKLTMTFQANPQAQNASCFVLTDAFNKPVPVRDKSYKERFMFTAPFLTEKSRVSAASQAQHSVESTHASLTSQLDKAKAKLIRSGAFKNGQCVKPAQDPIPPKPKGYSANEVYAQANGGCTDMLIRRFGQNDTLNAFTRLSWDQRLLDWKRWSNNRSTQDECGKNLMSQAETSITKIGCSLFFKDELLPACIQESYNTCMRVAKRRCAGPIQSWERQVRRIKNAPDEKQQACYEAAREIVALSEKLDVTNRQVSEARRVSYQAQSNQTTAQRISLNDAQCTSAY